MKTINLEFAEHMIKYVEECIKNNTECFEQLKLLIDDQETLDWILLDMVNEYINQAINAYSETNITLEDGFNTKDEFILELKTTLNLFPVEKIDHSFETALKSGSIRLSNDLASQRKKALALGKKFETK